MPKHGPALLIRWNSTAGRRQTNKRSPGLIRGFRRLHGLAWNSRCDRTSDRAPALADLHGLHGSLGFRSRGKGHSRTDDNHRLGGGSLFDDGAALRGSVLHDVELCCQRGSGKRRKSCRGNQQFNPHKVLLMLQCTTNQFPARLVPPAPKGKVILNGTRDAAMRLRWRKTLRTAET
jgi:hypothetical protein